MSKLVETLRVAFSYVTQGTPFEEIAPLLDELDEVKVAVWREDESVKLPIYSKKRRCLYRHLCSFC